ncbi:unnamed protein product [Acanthoscelides obtectus]|uniref:Uncharacterized protein n=1 Tax=Acanthoscelides obtectus TaxID=200917 RepID=A0A9P0KTJ6_ACAOB|nr:unnamed protein product [Acanthoscelides obtectus]CAK1634438.1 hypothetical protein AOBTE_LOCUS8756 [Acanthoscelides obtectus]
MAFLENIKEQGMASDHLIAWSDSAEIRQLKKSQKAPTNLYGGSIHFNHGRSQEKTPFNITRTADKFVHIKELPGKLEKTTTNEKFSFRDVRWFQIEEFGKTKYRYP